MEKNKFLEGCKLLNDGTNRYRIFESISIDKNSIVSTKSNKENLIESINGKDVSTIGDTFLIKVWSKENMNKNGRNYKLVMNKVLQEKKVTVGFKNHPEDDKEIGIDMVCLVAKNPQMIVDTNNEEWLAVEITFVGTIGQLCLDILNQGAPLEFSSSCLGECDYSGYVKEEGFFLERYCDVVFNSSNNTLFYKDQPVTKHIIKEPIPKNSAKYYDDEEESITETSQKVTIYNKEEKTMEPNSKLLEEVLITNIKGSLKEATKTEDLAERKAILESALNSTNMLTDKSICDTITEKLKETNSQIFALTEKGKSVDSLNISIESLTKEKTTLTEQLEAIKKEKAELEDKYNQIVEMYETKQFLEGAKEIKEKEKLISTIASYKKEISILENSNKSILKSNKVLKEKVQNLEDRKTLLEAKANSKADAEIVASLQEDNQFLIQEVEKLQEANKKLLGKSLQEKSSRMDYSSRKSRFEEIRKRVVESKKEPVLNEQVLGSQKVEDSLSGIGNDTDISKLIESKGLV